MQGRAASFMESDRTTDLVQKSTMGGRGGGNQFDAGFKYHSLSFGGIAVSAGGCARGEWKKRPSLCSFLFIFSPLPHFSLSFSSPFQSAPPLDTALEFHSSAKSDRLRPREWKAAFVPSLVPTQVDRVFLMEWARMEEGEGGEVQKWSGDLRPSAGKGTSVRFLQLLSFT